MRRRVERVSVLFVGLTGKPLEIVRIGPMSERFVCRPGSLFHIPPLNCRVDRGLAVRINLALAVSLETATRAR